MVNVMAAYQPVVRVCGTRYIIVHHCGTVKSALILLIHGTNMKIQGNTFAVATQGDDFDQILKI
jgi:hypothetical protein